MARATREKIMDVALEMFAYQGVAATPVTKIEEAVGLSPGSGSFYRHFRDKHELLAVVVEREMARVSKDPAAQAAQAPAGTLPAQALARQLLSDLDFLKDLRFLIAILMWERDRAPDIAQRVQNMLVDRGVELGVLDLLARTTAQPVLDDPAAAATVMMSAVVGYFLTVEYFGSPPADVTADQFTTTLARLVTGDARPSPPA